MLPLEIHLFQEYSPELRVLCALENLELSHTAGDRSCQGPAEPQKQASPWLLRGVAQTSATTVSMWLLQAPWGSSLGLPMATSSLLRSQMSLCPQRGKGWEAASCL